MTEFSTTATGSLHECIPDGTPPIRRFSLSCPSIFEILSGNSVAIQQGREIKINFEHWCRCPSNGLFWFRPVRHQNRDCCGTGSNHQNFVFRGLVRGPMRMTNGNAAKSRPLSEHRTNGRLYVTYLSRFSAIDAVDGSPPAGCATLMSE